MRTRCSILTLVALAGVALPALAQVTPDQALSAGPGHPWQGAAQGVNLYSRARLTDVPVVGWTARGGLPVSFTLHHSSKAVFSNPALSAKWTHSYDTHLQVWNDAGVMRAALVWGDQRIQMFNLVGGTWQPTDGYRDSLAAFGAGYRVTLRGGMTVDLAATPDPARFRLQAITDRNGNAIALTYNAAGQLTKVADPNQRNLTFTYNVNTGKLTRVKFMAGSFSRSWTLTHNTTTGRFTGVKWPTVTTDGGPLTPKVSFAYNAAGNISTLTDLNGKPWKSGYAGDALSWIQWPGNTTAQRIKFSTPTSGKTTVTDAMGVKATYEYDGLSRLVRLVDSQGNAQARSYADPDYGWLPSDTTDASGATNGTDYDSRGNPVGVIDAAGNRTDLTWDAGNRLVQVLEPLVTDAWGIPEPARCRAAYTYDARGNVVRVRREDGVGSFFDVTYTVDLSGLVTATDVQGRVTTYAYDAYGNRSRVQTPAGRVFEARWESALSTHGYTRPNAVIDGLGQRADVAYDEWGRTRSTLHPDGSGATYSYDAMGRLVRMVDSTGQTDWVYTPAGLRSDEVNSGGSVHTDYLPNGLPSTLVEMTATGQRVRAYAYDPRNLLAVVDDGGGPITYQYDAAGRLVQRVLPNGASSSYTYAAGRAESITHFDAWGGVIGQSVYAYQADGLRSAAHAPGATTLYGYDFLDRVVREERIGPSGYQYDWDYDGQGNRVRQVRNGIVTSYMHDADGLVVGAISGGRSGDSYTWDANARLVRSDVNGLERLFHYDFAGRLVQMEARNGLAWMPSSAYQYDGLDRRVQRDAFDAQGAWMGCGRYGYAGATPLSETTTDASGYVAGATMAYCGGRLEMYADMHGVSYPGSDLDGSARTATDQTGNWTGLDATYTCFGEPVMVNGSCMPFGYAADSAIRTDGDAGMVYLGGGCYFDPSIVMLTDSMPWVSDPDPSTRLDGGCSTDFVPGIQDPCQGGSGELAPWPGQGSGFQAEGPIICQALFQRLAPVAPFNPVYASCQDPPQPTDGVNAAGRRRINELIGEIRRLQAQHDSHDWISDFWGEKRKNIQRSIDERLREIRDIMLPR